MQILFYHGSKLANKPKLNSKGKYQQLSSIKSKYLQLFSDTVFPTNMKDVEHNLFSRFHSEENLRGILFLKCSNSTTSSLLIKLGLQYQDTSTPPSSPSMRLSVSTCPCLYLKFSSGVAQVICYPRHLFLLWLSCFRQIMWDILCKWGDSLP